MLLDVKKPQFPGASTKLHSPWKGPYEIIEKCGDVNRKICSVANPDDVQLVHVERIKPFIEREEPQPRRRGGAGGQQGPDVYEVDEILQEREEGGEKQYLVKWKGFTARHNRWEAEHNLKAPEILQRFREREEGRR